MINEYIGDIFKECRRYDILLHQVNMRGKMGSGVARGVKENFPSAYNDYMKYYKDAQLGDVLYSEIAKNTNTLSFRSISFTIAHLFGQDRYGYDGAQYTNLYALETAYIDVMEFMLDHCIKRVITPRIGSGLGGASWEDVLAIMQKHTPVEFVVDVYRLE